MDISVGGHLLPNGDPDELLVWAVTVTGQVHLRQGVRLSQCPEGTGWLHVPLPERCQACRIGVGPTGLVWALTWHGKALIRLGVTRLQPSGTSWSLVEPPSPQQSLATNAESDETTLVEICVGENAVWATSRDGALWFRNGVKGAHAGHNQSMARGTKWVEMVGSIHSLSIGPNDHLVGLPETKCRDRRQRSVISRPLSVLLRTGITPADLTGKTWQPICPPVTAAFDAEGIPAGPKAGSSFHPPRRRATSGSSPAAGTVASSSLEHPSIPGTSPRTGSSNAYFHSMGNKVARNIVASAAASLTGATVGRLPVVGGPLSLAAGEMIRDEIGKIQVMAGSDKKYASLSVVDSIHLYKK